MNFYAHKRVAALSAKLAGLTQEQTDKVVQFATFPDEVADLYVKGVGTKLFGHSFCSLVHFCAPMEEGLPPKKTRFRGYCWKRDVSIPHVDLPNHDVTCQPQKWQHMTLDQNMGFDPPMYELIETLRNTGSCLAADEVTYSSVASLAGSLVGFAFLETDPVLIASCYGAADHCIADSVIPHHARGWLGRGHAEFEDKHQTWLGKQKDEDLLKDLPKIPVAKEDSSSVTARRLVERCAYISSHGGWKPTEAAFMSQTKLAIASGAAMLRTMKE